MITALVASLAISCPAAQDIRIQTVVATIADVAQDNAALPGKERVSGDALADLYIRRACGTGQPASAIVLGLAYALEPTGIIATNPITSSHFEGVETAAQRKARLAALGHPTLRGREDWLAHFVVSAGLAVATGGVAAELIGVQKELSDATGKDSGTGTGFSFTDLNADLAGIAFARWLTGATSKAAITQASESFEAARFLPDPAGLPDGLTLKEFEAAWGGIKDPRFGAECERLRQRVSACKAYAAPRADTGEPVKSAMPPEVVSRPPR